MAKDRIPEGHPLTLDHGLYAPVPCWTSTLQKEPQRGMGRGGFSREKHRTGGPPPAYLLCQGFGEGSEMGLSCSVHRVVDVRGDRLRPPKPRFCLRRKRGNREQGSRSSYGKVHPKPRRQTRALTWKERYSTRRGFLCTLVMTLQSGKEGGRVSARRATRGSQGNTHS